MSDAELARQVPAVRGLGRARSRPDDQTVLDLAWRIEAIDDIGELMRHVRRD